MENSRLCVKGLPKQCTDEKLRAVFAEFGELTDVKVCKNRDGKSRQFGYVGFARPKDAHTALESLDKSFIGMARIRVEEAKPVGDESLNPWSKYSVGSSSHRRLHPEMYQQSAGRKRPHSEITNNEAENPATKLRRLDGDQKKKWEEFLELAAPDADPKSAMGPGKEANEETGKEETLDPAFAAEIVEVDPSVEDVGESGRLFVRNLSYQCTEEDLQTLFGQHGLLSDVTIPRDMHRRSKGFAYVLYVNPECAVKALSGLDGITFQGRLLHVMPAKPAREYEERASGEKSSFKKQREAQLRKEAASNEQAWHSLFLRSDTVLTALADRLGVTKGDIMDKDADNLAVRVALGETHVLKETMEFLSSNGLSVEALNASVRKDPSLERSNICMLVKNLPADVNEDELRTLFGRFGPLSRFLMPPIPTIAIVEYLEPSEAKKAFKALAYKKYHSVPLYLEWSPSNADCQYPAAVTRVEQKPCLVQLSALAATGRVVRHLADARRSGPLAVYPGRLSVFVSPAMPPAPEKPESAVSAPETEQTGATVTRESGNAPAKTLFVKNLNFLTTEETLKRFFEGVAPVRSVSIATKLVKQRVTKPGSEPSTISVRKSMGYGFVEFAAEEDSQKALKRLQGGVVDGHAVQLAFSQRPTEKSNKRGKKKVGDKEPGRKVMVRNVPFEATRKDIRELFGAYGMLKSVRLPQKFDGSHRGFAFVEFVTKHEAKSAFESLRNSHLLGRHLVLEWAEEPAEAEGDSRQ